MPPPPHRRTFRLLGPDGVIRESASPGLLGGNGKDRIYGRLDCPSALRALRRPDAPYRKHRVFFASEADAVAAGFRPCARCLPKEYREWKRERGAADRA